MEDTLARFVLTGIFGLLGGGFGAAVVAFLAKRWEKRFDRKAVKEDRAEEKADKTALMEKHISETDARLAGVEDQNKAIIEALRVILLDRIRYLGQAYIEKGEIDFDDRRIFHMMHDSYHTGLGGNGDADLIVEAVDDLPLTVAHQHQGQGHHPAKKEHQAG